MGFLDVLKQLMEVTVEGLQHRCPKCGEFSGHIIKEKILDEDFEEDTVRVRLWMRCSSCRHTWSIERRKKI